MQRQVSGMGTVRKTSEHIWAPYTLAELVLSDSFILLDHRPLCGKNLQNYSADAATVINQFGYYSLSLVKTGTQKL